MPLDEYRLFPDLPEIGHTNERPLGFCPDVDQNRLRILSQSRPSILDGHFVNGSSDRIGQTHHSTCHYCLPSRAANRRDTSKAAEPTGFLSLLHSPGPSPQVREQSPSPGTPGQTARARTGLGTAPSSQRTAKACLGLPSTGASQQRRNGNASLAVYSYLRRATKRSAGSNRTRGEPPPADGASNHTCPPKSTPPHPSY